MSIEANAAARDAAKLVHSMMLDEAANHKQRAAVIFYEEIVKQLRAVVPEEIWPTTEVVRDAPMTDEEAARFELNYMPFGMHADKWIRDVPRIYLEWLECEPDFRRQLNRYLRSDKVANEPREQDQCQ